MIQVKCIQKFRDKNNQIYGYKLQDINGQTQDVESKNLKKAIKNGDIHVVNLRLTSDNRLVDSNEKQLQSKSLGNSPLGKNYESVGKAMRYISYGLLDMGDSLTEIVDTLAYNAGIEVDVYDIEQYYNKPEFKDCGQNERRVLYRIMAKCYTKCAEKKPEIIENELSIVFTGDYGYTETLEHNLEYEKVNNINDSKLYKSLTILISYAKHQNFDNTLIKSMESFLNKISKSSMSAINVAIYTCKTYFRYLDSKIFGTISNDYFTVGHKITTRERKEFKIYKGYEYICHKDFNILNRPETPICALFKDAGDKVTVDIKLARHGYVGERTVAVVGYIKDIKSITLDKKGNEEEWGKLLADAFNEIGEKVLEYAKHHPEIKKLNPLGQEVKSL